MSDTGVIEEQKTAGPGSGADFTARIVVLNDDHNTFEGVAAALARVLPGVKYADGMEFATTIHMRGQACVWTGPREVGELYWEQLRDSNLTMAPLQ